jgi:ketosteroid isomerase-like protein
VEPRPLDRIKKGLSLFNSGDYARSVNELSPAIEWDTTHAVPDGRLYRGREEVLGFWTGLPERWDDFRIEAEEWIEGDGVVLMLGRLEARGVDSGVPVTGSWDQVWRVGDGEIVRCENFTDRAAARRASGLDQA